MGDDIWNIIFAYNTWVSSRQLYASRWEVQYQVLMRECSWIANNVFNFCSICWRNTACTVCLHLGAQRVIISFIHDSPITYVLECKSVLCNSCCFFNSDNRVFRELINCYNSKRRAELRASKVAFKVSPKVFWVNMIKPTKLKTTITSSL